MQDLSELQEIERQEVERSHREEVSHNLQQALARGGRVPSYANAQLSALGYAVEGRINIDGVLMATALREAARAVKDHMDRDVYHRGSIAQMRILDVQVSGARATLHSLKMVAAAGAGL